MNVINVVGNGVLIFGFHRGVEGVAIPTLISRAVAAVAMVVLLRRPSLPLHLPEKFSFRHEKAIVKNILLLGVPNGVEGSMALLRRRIRDPHLTMEGHKVGGRSQTDVVLCYMDDRVDHKLLDQLRRKLDSIDVHSLSMATAKGSAVAASAIFC